MIALQAIQIAFGDDKAALQQHECVVVQLDQFVHALARLPLSRRLSDGPILLDDSRKPLDRFERFFHPLMDFSIFSGHGHAAQRCRTKLELKVGAIGEFLNLAAARSGTVCRASTLNSFTCRRMSSFSTPQNRDIVVIGASAGGVPALQQVVAGLPPGLPAALFVVLHTFPGAESYLPQILNRAGRLMAVHGQHDAPIEHGKIYVAPVDRHMMIEDGRIFISHGPRENRFRPAINPLFRSAALAHRQRVIAVILTGLLDDGAAGMWAVKHCGGIGVVQSDAQFDDMPRRTVEKVAVDHWVPLSEIAPLLVRLAGEPFAPQPDLPVPEVIRMNDQKSKMKTLAIDLDRVGHRSVFTCPECNGALWELKEGSQLQYACHVGHNFTAAGLDQAQAASIEQSLWNAVRQLKENAAMHERLARRASEQGLDSAAEMYRRTAAARAADAANVQAMLDARGATAEKSAGFD